MCIERHTEQQHGTDLHRMCSGKLHREQRPHGMSRNDDMRILFGKQPVLFLYLPLPCLHIGDGQRFRIAAVPLQQNAGDGVLFRDIVQQKAEILRCAQNTVQQQYSGIRARRCPEDVVISAVHRKNSTFPHCLQ